MRPILVKGELKKRGEFGPWAAVDLHDFPVIEKMHVAFDEGLEIIEVRFDPDFETPTVKIELCDENGHRKMELGFWNDAAEKLLAAFKTIVEELEWDDVEEKVTA